MSAVLDTHVVIWNALVPQKLSEPAKSVFDQAVQPGSLIISDITLWEIGMMINKGRLQVDGGCQHFLNLLIEAYGLVVRPISPQIATLANQLPTDINKDPADRLIVATALAEQVPLVTADRNLRAATLVPTVW